MNAVATPIWANGKKNEYAAILIETINNELKRDPKQSLAEFAKNLNDAIVYANFKAIKRIEDAQFDKE